MFKQSNHIYSILIALCLIVSVVSFRILSYMPIIVCLIFIPIVWNEKSELIKKIPKSATVMIFAAISALAISLFWSDVFDETLKRLTKTAPLLLLSLLFLSLSKVIKLNAIDYKILLGGFIVSATLFVTEISNFYPVYHLVRGSDQFITWINPSEYNHYVCASILIFLVLFFHTDNFVYRAILIGFAIPIFIVTESQSAQFALLAGITFYVITYPLKKYTRHLLIIGTILVAISSPWIIHSVFENKPTAMNGTLDKKASIMMRLEIWNGISENYIFKKPITGYGAEFLKKNELGIEKIYFKKDNTLHPHNFVVQLWLEFGVIGIIAFLSAFAFFVQTLKTQTFKQQHIISSIIIAVLSIFYTGYGMWQSWLIGTIFIISGLYLALSHKDHSLSAQKQQPYV